MPDRENVIKTLEKIKAQTKEIGLDKAVLAHKFMDEIMELLKEQEAVEPTYEDFFGNRVARCGNCNGYVVRYKYCPGCGRQVKWDD